MEQFKFRAYNKIQKRMFPVYGLGTSWLTEDTLDGVDPGQNCFDEEQMKDIIVMQYTGKRSYNLDLVFADDILRFSDSILLVVRFDQNTSAFVFDVVTTEDMRIVDTIGLYEPVLTVGQMVIIGNIHENPELIQL